MDGWKTVSDNVNGGIISEQNSRVWSEGIKKIVDEGREEGGAKNRALGENYREGSQ